MTPNQLFPGKASAGRAKIRPRHPCMNCGRNEGRPCPLVPGTSSPPCHSERSGGTSSPQRVSPDDPLRVTCQTLWIPLPAGILSGCVDLLVVELEFLDAPDRPVRHIRIALAVESDS